MFAGKMLALMTQLRQLGIRDERVLDAIASVPRHCFVDEALAHQAYDNISLPIGVGQTISQPYIVAKMTELLTLTPESRVLEVGTGSGYQTAVLSYLVDFIYSIERIKSLQWQTKRRLKKLDRHNVLMKHGNGWLGWSERAPFDAIIVTAAAHIVPASLLDQLADNGRLVIPIGDDQQDLQLIQRKGSSINVVNIEPVHFVPLVEGDII